MHSKREILMGSGCIGFFGSQPAIYLTQVNLNSVLLEGFMVNCFPTARIENFHGFPTRILSPELMDKFHEQPLRFGQEDEEPETADTVIVATGAGVKESGISACTVCDGAVPIFRNKPLAVTGDCDSAAEEANLTKYGSYVYVITILWNTVATESQNDSELLKNFRIKNTQTGSEKVLAVTNPQRRSFRTQLQTDPDGYIVIVPGTDSNFCERRFFVAGDGQDKVVGSGCMAALEAERLIAEEEEKEMMGE
ncbi:hypothetical protein K435DRAFT_817260 [Dendrothele bispora CBS 962.96]|uniref:FAD/NAD(P)-binding domain-containing protein n=1 Tax=Dendrothele bispora (strain CBS 962.96) TaxID=1314807 RepID=A0A4S8MKR6_DENBC|nr:hypothetical protein K435DRAFT_817260 [Dendrothele bispora CBS 962.96]